MSSILKALRRLEEDRARNSSNAPEIAASLLRSGARRRPAPSWLWPGIITVAVTAVMIFLWLWQPLTVASPIVPSASAPPPLISPASPGRGGEIVIEEVIDQRRPVLSPPSSVPLAPIVTRPGSVNQEKNKIEPQLIPPVTTNTLPPAPIEERQSPVVSAIAWQDDSAARMAVVDGLPVMTGESIGTARVQEIQRDRILFVEGGVLFAVRLTAQ